MTVTGFPVKFMHKIMRDYSSHDYAINTCCARAGGTCVNNPDFFENHQFHVIYCVTLAYVLFWGEFLILNSRGFLILRRIIDWICWACAIFWSIPNLQVCSDGQTDELIRVELGNLLRFLQVKVSAMQEQNLPYKPGHKKHIKVRKRRANNSIYDKKYHHCQCPFLFE